MFARNTSRHDEFLFEPALSFIPDFSPYLKQSTSALSRS
jgi:hypothetical protein